MFDVGFFELMLIGVVALLVVGPERLPKLARTAGMWLGKGKQMIGSVKADIEKEIKAEELKSILEKQQELNPVHEILDDTRKAMHDIEKETRSSLDRAADELSDAKDKSSSAVSHSSEEQTGK